MSRRRQELPGQHLLGLQVEGDWILAEKSDIEDLLRIVHAEFVLDFFVQTALGTEVGNSARGRNARTAHNDDFFQRTVFDFRGQSCERRYTAENTLPLLIGILIPPRVRVDFWAGKKVYSLKKYHGARHSRTTAKDGGQYLLQLTPRSLTCN